MYSPSNTNTRSVKESANKLKNEAREDIEEVREGLEVVKDDLRDVANRAGRKVRNFIDSASSEATHVRDTVTHRIEDKPVQSALIALGAGFILGALFRR